MQEEAYPKTIPQMVEDVREGKLPRRNFMKALAALGISAAGASAIAGAAANSPVAKPVQVVHPRDESQKNLHLHQQHLAKQTQSNTSELQHDYAMHAVVEDSMYSQPFVGRAAIMARKGIGMAAMADLKITVSNRVAHGPQVVVEWIATGTHSGDFPGLPASGRPFSIRGVTVVVRHEGKIVREAIYYDMEEVRRQLGPA
jgi:steroid delta-isomerase-like uncharacterized protein